MTGPAAPELHHRSGRLHLEQPAIMAILNLTPDSFSDGGTISSVEDALRRAETSMEAGADLLDLGAESTRPGASPVDEETEARRLLPALEAIRARFGIPISVDTWRATTAQRALEAGADIINDVGGGRWDRTLLDVVVRHQAGWVIMHSPPSRASMHATDPTSDSVPSMLDFWSKALHQATAAGLAKEALVFDPGFGFGKDVETNHRLFRALSTLTTFERPVLAGISRKRMLRALSGGSAEDLEHATTAAHTLALMHGVRILRTHHVGAARAARAVWCSLGSEAFEAGPTRRT